MKKFSSSETLPGATTNVEIGDLITFQAITRWSNAKVTRMVNGFNHKGLPTVRYGGWENFVVRYDEILAVKKAEGVPAYEVN